MELKNQKRLAAQILKCSSNRVRFDQDKLSDIKESITKADIRSLVNDKVIVARPVQGTSRFWARKRQGQVRKGRRKGVGSRKGTANARSSDKRTWVNSVRAQRKLLKTLKDKKMVLPQVYHDLYRKVKGGFFRSKNHIKIYVKERDLVRKVAKK